MSWANLLASTVFEDGDEPEDAAPDAEPGRVYQPFDPRPLLFPKALEAYEDSARDRVWQAGRGAAKTTTYQLWLLELGTRYPGCTSIICANTAQRAIDITWPDFKALNEQHDLGARLTRNSSGGTIAFPEYGDSRIIVTGADSPELFERKKGFKNVIAVVFEEAQDWKSAVLEYAVTKIFGPRLGDAEKRFGIKGRILMVGTGTRKKHYLARATEDPALGFSAKRWTQWENPHIADPQGEFEHACKLSKIDPKNPDEQTRRQWMAENNDGASDLTIFKKVTTVPRSSVPTKLLELVVGIDFGTVDFAAGVAWVFHKHDPRIFLVRDAQEAGLSNSKQVRFSRAFTHECVDEYHPVSPPEVVGDGGGLGKGNVMDIASAEEAWEVEGAEKSKKVINIRLMRGDLEDGTAVVCDDLLELLELFKDPQWHPDHVGERIAGHMPDKIDAAYMSYRRAKALHRYEPPPPELTPEEQRAQAYRDQLAEEAALRDNPYG